MAENVIEKIEEIERGLDRVHAALFGDTSLRHRGVLDSLEEVQHQVGQLHVQMVRHENRQRTTQVFIVAMLIIMALILATEFWSVLRRAF